MTQQASEAEIIEGLRNGEPEAWDALCDQFDQRLWTYVARLIGADQAAVADVFQETMLAVAGSGRTLRRDSKLWPWLIAIAHNQTALFWRRRYRDAGNSEGLDGVPESVTADPAVALSQIETVQAVRCMLAEMDADHVCLLTAKYIDGLSVAEIVALMGGTTESVRSRLARARRNFRERYQRVSAEW